MSGGYFNVSGINRKDESKEIFVWCRAEGETDYALLEKGQAVSADDVRPTGISVGQFSVTFLLPADCSTESLIVTSDVDAEEPLPDVTVTPCS